MGEDFNCIFNLVCKNRSNFQEVQISVHILRSASAITYIYTMKKPGTIHVNPGTIYANPGDDSCKPRILHVLPQNKHGTTPGTKGHFTDVKLIICCSQRSIRDTQVDGSRNTSSRENKKLSCKCNRFPRSDGTQTCRLTILEYSFSSLFASKHASFAQKTL